MDEIFVSDGAKSDLRQHPGACLLAGQRRCRCRDPVYPAYVDDQAGLTGRPQDQGLQTAPVQENGFTPALPDESVKPDLIYLC